MNFDHFRDFLQQLDMPERRGTRDEEFVVLLDGTTLSVPDALQQLPQEELESADGINHGFTTPVFLDIYKEPSGKYCRHILKAQYAIEYEQQEAHAEEQRIQHRQEHYPDARYFVCEFSQDTWGALHVSHVMSLQGYVKREDAEKSASRDEQKMYRLRKYDVVMQARLAASFEDAKAGRFLDE